MAYRYVKNLLARTNHWTTVDGSGQPARERIDPSENDDKVLDRPYLKNPSQAAAAQQALARWNQGSVSELVPCLDESSNPIKAKRAESEGKKKEKRDKGKTEEEGKEEQDEQEQKEEEAED